MYCSKCGKMIADDSRFCDFCGTPTSLVQTPMQTQQAPQQSVYTVPTKPEPTNADVHFRQSWRTFATSPIALILLIIYSVGALMNASDAKDLLDNLSGVLAFLGDEVVLQSDLLYIGLVVPGIVIAIGMWMLYVEAFNRSNSALQCNGFQLIRIVNIASAILFCIGVGDVFLKIYKVVDNVHPDFREYIIETLFEELGWEVIQLIVAVVVMIVMTVKINGMLLSMRSCVTGGYASAEGATGVAVYQFIVGAWLIYILTDFGVELDELAELPLGIVISIIMPFVFGIMLLRHKSFMNKMYSELRTFTAAKRSDEVPAAAAQSSYLHTPAWKRVQEKQSGSTKQ